MEQNINRDQLEALFVEIKAPAHAKDDLRGRLPFIVAGRLGMARHPKDSWDYIAHQHMYSDSINAANAVWHRRADGEQSTPIQKTVDNFLRKNGHLS